MVNIPFDQYQRYKMTQIIIDKFRKNKNHGTFCILEVGANAHKNLGRFLCNDKIVYVDNNFSDEELNGNSDFIRADGTNLPFADSSFDFVVSLDVLEHVDKENREKLLVELKRVARELVIISVPIGNEAVYEMEERLNEIFEKMYGNSYEWFDEHKLYKIPRVNEIEDILKTTNCYYQYIQHGNLEINEQLMWVYMVSVFDEELTSLRQEIEEYYEEHLFEKDFSDQCYRMFWIYTDKKQNIENMIYTKRDIIEKDDLEKFYRKVEDFKSQFTIRSQSQRYSPEYISKLYVDYGDGFNENDILISKIKNGNFELMFSGIQSYKSGKHIKNIRWDPLEGEYCSLKISNIKLKNNVNQWIEIKKENINFINSEEIDGEQFFYNIDPIIIINDSCEADCLKIEGTLKLLNSNQIYDKIMFLNEQLEQNHIKLFEVQQLLGLEKEQTKQLAISLQELQQDNAKYREDIKELKSNYEVLYRFKEELINSKSWKITKPMRSLFSVVKNMFK